MILDSFGLAQLVVLLVALQRLGELALARRNARRLLAAGAVEHGRAHYPFIIALHVAWLLAMFFLVSPEQPAHLWLLGLYLLVQVGRVWVIASLGRFWTTRVITLPDTPLVRSGPYRVLRHPNYAVITAEIALLPLAFDAWGIALVFSLLNAALLWIRIRVEDQALAQRR